MRIAAGTALLSLALSAPAVSQSVPALDTATEVARQSEGADIIVRGRRSERYRIPPELRTLGPERSERWRKELNRDLGCQHVGPRGCGPPVMRIVTVTSDGKVRIGQKEEK